MKQTFEQYLERDVWEAEGVLDDDMEDAFNNWLAELDVQELADYAQTFAEKSYLEGKEIVMKEFEPIIENLKKVGGTLVELSK